MPTADLILKNARVVTVDPRQPAAEMVAVSGDKISLVGSNDDLASVQGPNSKVIDCEGKAVVPGFNDAHHHVHTFLRKQLGVEISPAAVSSISDIKAAIGRRAKETPPGQWIIGTDYIDFLIEEKRPPNRWELDEVAPDHPVMLICFSVHPCVVNSRGLAEIGINRDSPDLPLMPIDRDPQTGEPTGVLAERALHIQEQLLPPLSEKELARAAAMANEHYLSQGITSIQEATVVNSFTQWQRFQHLKQTDRLKTRIYMMAGMDNLSEFQTAGLVTGSGDEYLRLGPAKMYILNEPDGTPFPAQAELNKLALNAHRAGFQLAIHTLQESSLKSLIEALEYTQSQAPDTNRRHCVEHCSPCPSQYLDRLKKLEVVAVTQPTWIYYSGDRYLAQRGIEQMQWLSPLRSLLDTGVTVASSSDCPVVPDNVLIGMCAAVTRKTRAGEQIVPDQGISPAEALATYTINGAYASFEEDIKGSITAGKLADMVVLSDDPTGVPVEAIKDIKVEMTILGGEVVWES
jgi:predicted amidohydrolase YtcJ